MFILLFKNLKGGKEMYVIVSHSAALKDPYCLLSIPENRRRNLKIIVPKETIDRLTHIAYNSVDRKKGISAEYAKAFLGWFNEAMGSSKFGFSEVSFSLGGIFSLAQAINEKVGNEKAQILTTFDEEKILAKHYGIELFTDIVYDPNAVARHVYSKFPKTLTIDVPKEIIDNAFLSEPKILPPDFGVENYFPNQNYVLRCGNVHALLTYNSFVNKLEKVTLPNSDCKKGDKMVSVFGPKNFDQCFFSHHIKSPARRLTVGFGVSGGGKSVGAVVGAFSQILTNGNSETTKTGPLFDEMFGFKRIIFFKGSDPDSETYPGILPGNARQKVDHETGSLRDLLDILAGHDEIEILKSRKNDPDLLGSLEAEKILSFESLAGITGRSFVRSMVLIDEAQLYSEKIIQVLLNRMGRGTKVIITGDLLQMGVDGYLHNNGLSFVAEKLAYNPYVAFVSFEQSVRSITSQMCAEAFAKMF
jgi:hypothetical protein